jgi:hypothetical protein
MAGRESVRLTVVITDLDAKTRAAEGFVVLNSAG